MGDAAIEAEGLTKSYGQVQALRGIDLAVTEVVKQIASQAKKVKSSAEIEQIGTIAANGEAETETEE